MNSETFKLVVSYVVLAIYLSAILFAIVLPIITNFPPETFIIAIKKFGGVFSGIASVAFGIIANKIGVGTKTGTISKINAVIIAGTIVIVMVVCAGISLWPPISGYPAAGYNDLLTTIAAPAVCGFVFGLALK